jgi:hypothetical protein
MYIFTFHQLANIILDVHSKRAGIPLVLQYNWKMVFYLNPSFNRHTFLYRWIEIQHALFVTGLSPDPLFNFGLLRLTSVSPPVVLTGRHVPSPPPHHRG